MNIDTLKDVPLWCLTINYGVLLVWFFAFVFAKKQMYSIHMKWFSLKEEEFDSIHYRSWHTIKLE